MKCYRYLCCILLLALPTFLAAQATGNYVCSNADFKGIYAFSWHDASYQYDSEGNPLAAPLRTIGVGVFIADGMGRYVGEMPIWEHAWQSPAAEHQGATALDKRYTVNADCTGSGTWAHPATGQVLYEYALVVMDGGREIRMLGLTADPLGLVVAKRVEPFDQELQTKVDALAAELTETKSLLKKMARVLGLRP